MQAKFQEIILLSKALPKENTTAPESMNTYLWETVETGKTNSPSKASDGWSL